jgi:hypothetical protein
VRVLVFMLLALIAACNYLRVATQKNVWKNNEKAYET